MADQKMSAGTVIGYIFAVIVGVMVLAVIWRFYKQMNPPEHAQSEDFATPMHNLIGDNDSSNGEYWNNSSEEE